MKEHLKQAYITIKLILNRRHALRKEAFLEWEHKVASACLVDNVDAIFFISDEIANEFGWAEMVEMKRNFRQASQSAQSLAMRVTDEARRREYIAARQSLQIIPSKKTICVTWNEQVARWREELSLIADIRDTLVVLTPIT